MSSSNSARALFRNLIHRCVFVGGVGCSVLLISAPPDLLGQQATAKIELEQAEKDIVALSPFTVTADRDNGYQASTSLAGTRLKTDLKDIGASISVVTRDFLRDVGATDTASLLAFTTGTEVAGLRGNMSGSVTTLQGLVDDYNVVGNNSSSTTRVRGLAAATEARDFFNTLIPLDSYNVERIEINRGANSVLFGTGSPAGIINSVLKKAEMKNSFEIEGRYGSYGTARASFDLNRQIIPGELAVRLNALDKHAKFQQRYSYSHDKRLHGAMTYAPRWARTKSGLFSGTILRAGIEVGERDSAMPRLLPPVDQLSTWYQPYLGLAPAKRTWDPLTMTVPSYQGSWTGNPSVGVQSFWITNMAVRGPSVWWNDPASGTPNVGITVNGSPIAGVNTVLSNMTNPPGTHYLAIPTDVYQSVIGAGTRVNGSSYFVQPSLTDTSVFDFRNQLIEGPNRGEFGNLRDNNFSLTQLFFGDRAGIDLNYDRQNYSYGHSGLYLYSVTIDINTNLLSGLANPNFGRPVSGGGWTSSHNTTEDETRRATAFYRFDFAEVAPRGVAKWLGTHTVSFLRQQREAESQYISGPRYTMPTYNLGRNLFITDGNGAQMGAVFYLGPNIANANSAAGAQIPGLTTFLNPMAGSGRNFQYRADPAGSPFVVVPQTIVDNGLLPYDSATTASWNKTKFYTSSAVLQSKILNGMVVATLGQRRDDVQTFTAPNPSRRAPDNHLVLTPDSWRLPSAPTAKAGADTTTKSVVVHTPGKLLAYVPTLSDLSLRYNTSENFQAGSARYDTDMNLLAPPTGKTKDYGVSVGFLKNRIVLGATWYETVQQGVTASAISQMARTMVQNWVTVMNFANSNPGFVSSDGTFSTAPSALAKLIPPPDNLLRAYGYTVNNGSAAMVARGDIVLTQDFVSKGTEFEAQINPTKNWRIFLSAAKQVAVRSNTGKTFADLLYNRKVNGETIAENWTGPAAQAVAYTQLASYNFLTRGNMFGPFLAQSLQDGGPAQELRRWRFNAVTNYTFSKEGRLKGFGVGSGVRWQSKVAIGFPVMDSGALGQGYIPDVLHPYYGPDALNVDSWVRYACPIYKGSQLTLELRVYNVLQNDKLIPVTANPNGINAVYRIPEVRSMEFVTRISF